MRIVGWLSVYERTIYFSFEAVMRSVATNKSGGSEWRLVKETPAKRLWKDPISRVDGLNLPLDLRTAKGGS